MILHHCYKVKIIRDNAKKAAMHLAAFE